MQSHGIYGAILRSCSALALIGLSVAVGAAGTGPCDCPSVNSESDASRYSPLAQIKPDNVARLQPAWVYHMKPAGAAASRPTALEKQQAQADQVGGPGQNGPGGPRRPGGFNPFSNGRF